MIYLRQSKENLIRRCPLNQAAPLLIRQLLLDESDGEAIWRACAILEELLKQTPVWLLENRGDRESAELTYRTIKEELT